VLIYQGQNDIVVNTPGILHSLNSQYWKGIRQWKKARKHAWIFNQNIQGWSKIWENLWFVFINGVGQMVPLEKPEPAIKMVQNFIKDAWEETD
jgi:carboxypeptidase C (cathepsin A)